MNRAWLRTISGAIAAASLAGTAVIACVGSDPDPITPTRDAARSGDDDDDDDGGATPAPDAGPDVGVPALGCIIGTEVFDFCDSFDGPDASFVPPWDSINVSDAGHLERADGGAICSLDRESLDGGTAHASGATTVKSFLGDIGTFVLERRVRVTPTDPSAEHDADPGIILSQAIFYEANGDAGYVFYHQWTHPARDAGTFDGAPFRDAFTAVALTVGGGQRSDSWAKPPRVGQWYLVRDTYEVTDTRVTFTVAVDGEQQLRTEQSLVFPHMRTVVLFNGPATTLNSFVPAHAGWGVEIDDVRVGIKPRH